MEPSVRPDVICAGRIMHRNASGLGFVGAAATTATKQQRADEDSSSVAWRRACTQCCGQVRKSQRARKAGSIASGVVVSSATGTLPKRRVRASSSRSTGVNPVNKGSSSLSSTLDAIPSQRVAEAASKKRAVRATSSSKQQKGSSKKQADPEQAVAGSAVATDTMRSRSRTTTTGSTTRRGRRNTSTGPAAGAMRKYLAGITHDEILERSQEILLANQVSALVQAKKKKQAMEKKLGRSVSVAEWAEGMSMAPGRFDPDHSAGH